MFKKCSQNFLSMKSHINLHLSISFVVFTTQHCALERKYLEDTKAIDDDGLAFPHDILCRPWGSAHPVSDGSQKTLLRQWANPSLLTFCRRPSFASTSFQDFSADEIQSQ